jgi:hypothetical protein
VCEKHDTGGTLGHHKVSHEIGVSGTDVNDLLEGHG